jgi:hypothetical protein
VALAVGDRIRRIVPISPVADLRPLIETTMNDDLRIDAAEAEVESPVLHPAPGVPVHVVVGALERPAFIEQAGMLARVWDAGLTVAAGRHHFDVIGPLADPESDLTALICG